MRISAARWRKFARRVRSTSIGRVAAVVLGAFFLSWPALYNGFPLLYPDSMTYLDDGRTVARAVFLHQLSGYYGMRSFFYSLGILPWHWNISPWPIVALQCLLVAWVVWLLVRAVAPRATAPRYLILMLLMSLLTSASWYSAFIMPDILGPVCYLAIYLLFFARDTLSRAERIGLYLAAWWGITAHATHLLLAAGLCVLLVGWAAFARRGPFFRRMLAVGEVAAIVGAAILSQLALNAYLYGKPSLNGERPAYLTARILADGPGRWYLQNHCSHNEWAVCAQMQSTSTDPDSFLWAEASVDADGSGNEVGRMEAEEMPFVMATLRAYPAQEFSRAMANFRDQLRAFGLYGFDPSDWMLGQFEHVLPRARSSYLQSRQARNALPLDQLTEIQWWTIIGSLVTIAVLIPFLLRRHSPRLAGLSLVILPIVVANALVTGVLAEVDDRYGCRAIWLVPLTAGIFFLDWLQQHEAARKMRRSGQSETIAASSV